MRTSITHPLYIDDLPVGAGWLGMTICPGKKGDSVLGADWDRDLDINLKAVRDWGAQAVVTLVEQEELKRLGAEALGAGVQARGIAWHHLPVRDLGAPDNEGSIAWRKLSPALHRLLDHGGKVLVHCRGGLGRAGTIAALLLLERGDSADNAIARIREVRKGAIETAEQLRFLEARASLPDARAERIRASLFAGAMGDALGAEIEFWSLGRIRRAFPAGLVELPPHDGRAGAITDDTQMTLFTAEGLIRAHVRLPGRASAMRHRSSTTRSCAGSSRRRAVPQGAGRDRPRR